MMVQPRGNVFSRMSEDEPEVFGTFAHPTAKDKVVRSHRDQKSYPNTDKAAQLLKSAGKDGAIPSLDIDALWDQVSGSKKRKKPMKWQQRYSMCEEMKAKPMNE